MAKITSSKQVKNGFSKSAGVSEIAVVENFALLEPLEVLEGDGYAEANKVKPIYFDLSLSTRVF